MTNQNQSDFDLSTDGDLTILTLKTSAELLFFVPKSDYDKLKEENQRLQKRVDVFERAKLIWERRSGDRADLMDASQEAQHYNWLDEQNEKLKEENQRLINAYK